MTVTLKKILHKNAFRIGIFFSSTHAGNAIAKSLGAIYSKTFRCWHLPYNKKSYERAREGFGDHEIIIEAASPVILQQPDEPPLSVQRLVSLKPVKKGSKKILPYSDIGAANLAEWLRLEQLLQLKGYSKSTQRTYKNEFGIFLKQIKHVAAQNFTEERIKAYLQYCYVALKLSEATIHSRMNALKFYYEQVLGREKFFWQIPRPKKPLQLPKVISEEKVLQGLLQTENIKHRTLLMVAYSAGLRVSEVVKLKLTDINADRMQLFIERAKGKKDRMATLSPFTLQFDKSIHKPYRVIGGYLGFKCAEIGLLALLALYKLHTFLLQKSYRVCSY